MKKLQFILYFGILLAHPKHVLSSEEFIPRKGTLIVTYKTDNKGERLNRIRFWLKDSEGRKLDLYPKSKAFVDDKEGPSRMVVIDDLPSGSYLVHFLVPNTDAYFQNVPLREVEITDGEVVKIDQQIKVAQPDKMAAKQPAQPEPDPETAPPQFDIPMPMDASTQPITPSIEEVPNDSLSETKEDAIKAENEYGKLILSYGKNTEAPLDNVSMIKFRLIDSIQEIPLNLPPDQHSEVHTKTGKMFMLRQIPPGTYRIVFYLEGNENNPIHEILDVKIDANATKTIYVPLALN